MTPQISLSSSQGTSMQKLLLLSYYYTFFRYLYLPYILKHKDRMATKVRQQDIREKARRLSNIITDSPYFSKLVDWAYGVCDPEGTNQIGMLFPCYFTALYDKN
jgi:hypothetical protein